jgi:hypothetical protein
VAALLDGDCVRLLGEYLADFGEVAVLRNLVPYLRGVVDEGELGALAVDNLPTIVTNEHYPSITRRRRMKIAERAYLLEALAYGLDGPDLSYRLEDVAVLLLDRVVPDAVLNLVARAVQGYFLPDPGSQSQISPH